jgi:hypothetical protein
MTSLDIELELVLERLLIFIIFFRNDFYFRDYLKYMNLELVLERQIEMLIRMHYLLLHVMDNIVPPYN